MDSYKDCSRKCKDYKCYLEYIEVRNKHFYGCKNVKIKIVMSWKYHTLKFLNVFKFCGKDCEKFVLCQEKV